MWSLRRVAVAAAVAIVSAFTPVAAQAAKHARADIVDTAASAGQFKTLVAAVKAAGLVPTLKGRGPFTVFAPTDAAFAKLPPGTLQSLLRPQNRAKLRSILTYHVVPGAVSARQLTASPRKRFSVATAQGARLPVDLRHGVKVGGANVVKTDIRARNGIIHVIDRVMLPPSRRSAH